ncbi:hypothetical protein PROFUN_08624, partial [Planoprotostelium fungivorum]
QLKEFLKGMGLNQNGRKPELVERLSKAGLVRPEKTEEITDEIIQDTPQIHSEKKKKARRPETPLEGARRSSRLKRKSS